MSGLTVFSFLKNNFELKDGGSVQAGLHFLRIDDPPDPVALQMPPARSPSLGQESTKTGKAVVVITGITRKKPTTPVLHNLISTPQQQLWEDFKRVKVSIHQQRKHSSPHFCRVRPFDNYAVDNGFYNCLKKNRS